MLSLAHIYIPEVILPTLLQQNSHIKIRVQSQDSNVSHYHYENKDSFITICTQLLNVGEIIINYR